MIREEQQGVRRSQMLESFLKVRLVHSVLINHLSMSGSFVHTFNLLKRNYQVVL